MKLLLILRDFAIVFALTFLAGAIVGFTWAFFKLDSVAYALTLGSIGFLIAGLLTRTDRWKRLFQVAIFAWLASLLNMLPGVTFVQWLFASFFILIMMGVGGGLATLASPEISKEDPA